MSTGSPAGVSPHKRKLLEMRLRKMAASPGEKKPTRRDPTSPAPLSFSQQRIWLTHQLEPGSPICNRSAHVRLRGKLDELALRRSLEEILRRHEALRTSFSESAGNLTQRVEAPRPIELPVRDLSQLTADEAELETRLLADQQTARPINLQAAPLLRAELVRLAANHHVLMLTFHHIAFDAWSMSILKSQLSALYSAFAENLASPLGEPPLQYADYAAWQHDMIDNGRIGPQLDYFRQKLAGPLPPLNLTTDLPRAPARTSRAGRAVRKLEPALCDAFRELAVSKGVTVFMLVLAAFKTLLCRYTGVTDIVVGSPFAGRNHVDSEQVIGCFINMLPLRTDLSGDPPFGTLLDRVKETVLGAIANQDVPIELLIQELRPQREVSRIPLFNVLFNYRNVPRTDWGGDGLDIEEFRHGQPIALLDLSLELTDAVTGMECALEYDADLFEHSTIESLLQQLEVLLKAGVADPSTPLSRLPLVEGHERERLIFDCNKTQRDFPRDRCFHELFTQSAARRPDAIAIRRKSQTVSYRELDQRSDELAARLRLAGVGPNAAVGLCLPRSIELIVGILGILKAGGAYVPLDPVWPADRLRYIRDDSHFAILVTSRSLARRFDDLPLDLVLIDESHASKCDQPVPPPQSSPEDRCYIMYTSGSTGRPKGVAIEHRSLVNYVSAAYLPLDLKADDAVLQFASATFDASVEDTFCPLSCGATIVLRPDEMLGSVSTFLSECERERITVLVLPTSYFHEVAEQLDRGRASLPPALRMVVIGGEALLPERLAQWHRRVGNSVRLINLYGPTETTVSATWWDCGQWLGRRGMLPLRCPIGRVAPNCQVYLLDSHLEPVPVAMPGELYIGGEGLARGYHNQPALTAERFIRHPFDRSPGARLFRTGDLARRLHDGNFEFLGRADQQVKVRGFRVEPEEIESVLLRHPRVCDAAVVPWNEAGTTYLAAYVVAEVGDHLSSDELTEFIAGQLPSYMVPSAIVVSERFPTTDSGKIDRRALPKPDWSPASTTQASPVYRDTCEETLASIWSEVLGVGKIGPGDNFFDIGGHSLLAVRLLSLVNDTFGTDLSPAAFFASPTLAHMSRLLRSSPHATPPSPLTCINQGAGLTPFFYLHGDFAGQGLYCANLARYLDPRRPFFVLHTLGADARPSFERIEQMAQYHLRQIQRIHPKGPYIVGGFCNGGAIAFEIARRLREKGESVPLVILIGSALDQMRVRPFFRIVRASGQLVGLPFDWQVAFALWVQKKHLRWRRVARNGTWASVRLAARKAMAFAKHAINRIASDRGRRPKTTPMPASQDGTALQILSERYHLAMAGYDPRPYTGRVAALWPQEEVNRYRRDPTLGWRRLARTLRITLIPGHHTTCLTLYGRQLAKQLDAILAEAATD